MSVMEGSIGVLPRRLMVDGRRYADAIEDFSKVLRLKPDDWSALLNRAVARYELKDYQGAEQDQDEQARPAGVTELAQLDPQGIEHTAHRFPWAALWRPQAEVAHRPGQLIVHHLHRMLIKIP